MKENYQTKEGSPKKTLRGLLLQMNLRPFNEGRRALAENAYNAEERNVS